MAIVGTHERSLDDKGRLVLPARFRSHFSGVVYLSPGDGCISLWPSERFDSMVASVEKRSVPASWSPTCAAASRLAPWRSVPTPRDG